MGMVDYISSRAIIHYKLEVRSKKMDKMYKVIQDLDNKRNEQGFETRWSMFGEEIVDLNDRVVNEERDMYRITYRAYDENMQEYEFSSFTATNTVEGFWRAAESVFQQAKRSVGDWHVFVEGFELIEDGSFRLRTGS